jgi:hypothetical protein
VVTGTDLLQDGQPPAGWPLDRPPMPLETSLPGNAVLGVRFGSSDLGNGLAEIVAYGTAATVRST